MELEDLQELQELEEANIAGKGRSLTEAAAPGEGGGRIRWRPAREGVPNGSRIPGGDGSTAAGACRREYYLLTTITWSTKVILAKVRCSDLLVKFAMTGPSE